MKFDGIDYSDDLVFAFTKDDKTFSVRTPMSRFTSDPTEENVVRIVNMCAESIGRKICSELRIRTRREEVLERSERLAPLQDKGDREL